MASKLLLISVLCCLVNDQAGSVSVWRRNRFLPLLKATKHIHTNNHLSELALRERMPLEEISSKEDAISIYRKKHYTDKDAFDALSLGEGKSSREASSFSKLSSSEESISENGRHVTFNGPQFYDSKIFPVIEKSSAKQSSSDQVLEEDAASASEENGNRGNLSGLEGDESRNNYIGSLSEEYSSSEDESSFTGDSSVMDKFPFELLIPFVDPSPHNAVLNWNYNLNQNNFVFKLFVPLESEVDPTEGSIIFGLSSRGQERNEDLMIVTWNQNLKQKQSLAIKDAHTDGYGIVHGDRDEDYELLSFLFILSEDDDDVDGVEIIARRNIDTLDENDFKIERGTSHVFVMVSPSSRSKGRLDFTVDNVMARPVTLLKSKRVLPPLPDDVKMQDFLVSDVKVPAANSATYWCKVLLFPDLQRKHHIVRYDAVISSGNEDVIHHIEIYHCEVPKTTTIPSYDGPCDDVRKPRDLESCQHVIAAWAMGAEPFVLPAEAGTPIGEPNWSNYVMIEIHYEHPKHNRDVIDNSGLRFYFTPTLRPFDAGVLEVGVVYSPNLSIPPHEGNFEMSGYCLPKCTDKGIPPDGIRLFASQLHTHVTGRAVWTRHFRNGRELPEVDHDDHFTPSFQEIKLLPQEILLLPGGYRISDEMCVNYLHYYPKADLEVCKSTLSSTSLDAFFKKSLRFEDKLSDRLSTEDKFRSVLWNAKYRELWRNIAHTGTIDEECLQSSGSQFEGDWTNIPLETTGTDPDHKHWDGNHFGVIMK